MKMEIIFVLQYNPPPQKNPPKTTQNKGKPAKQNKPNLKKRQLKS